MTDAGRPVETRRARPQDARVHAPARGNRRLQKLLDAVDAQPFRGFGGVNGQGGASRAGIGWPWRSAVMAAVR